MGYRAKVPVCQRYNAHRGFRHVLREWRSKSGHWEAFFSTVYRSRKFDDFFKNYFRFLLVDTDGQMATIAQFPPLSGINTYSCFNSRLPGKSGLAPP